MNTLTKRWLLISLFSIVLLIFIPSAFAQETSPTLTLTAATEDNPLIIRGRLDGQTNSFNGNVRLTVAGGDAAELRLLASDLQHDSQIDLQIDRSYITILAGINLSEGQPRDVRRRRQHLARHRPADVPHFDVDHRPHHEPNARGQFQRRSVDDGHIGQAFGWDHGVLCGCSGLSCSL